FTLHQKINSFFRFSSEAESLEQTNRSIVGLDIDLHGFLQLTCFSQNFIQQERTYPSIPKQRQHCYIQNANRFLFAQYVESPGQLVIKQYHFVISIGVVLSIVFVLRRELHP